METHENSQTIRDEAIALAKLNARFLLRIFRTASGALLHAALGEPDSHPIFQNAGYLEKRITAYKSTYLTQLVRLYDRQIQSEQETTRSTNTVFEKGRILAILKRDIALFKLENPTAPESRLFELVYKNSLPPLVRNLSKSSIQEFANAIAADSILSQTLPELMSDELSAIQSKIIEAEVIKQQIEQQKIVRDEKIQIKIDELRQAIRYAYSRAIESARKKQISECYVWSLKIESAQSAIAQAKRQMSHQIESAPEDTLRTG